MDPPPKTPVKFRLNAQKKYSKINLFYLFYRRRLWTVDPITPYVQ